MEDQELRASVPPGLYYMGDFALLFPDVETSVGPGDLSLMGIRGHSVAMFGASNPGTYRGSDGFEYPLESGVLCVVPQACTVAAAALDEGLIRPVFFETEFIVSNNQGLMTLGEITIDTTGGAL